ncbi:hypothetical protein B0J14DRAFT_149449 [Halenospora varia]|nr:hypothetical protein B0J14DRAFT_149449 [Halenospora varia]
MDEDSIRAARLRDNKRRNRQRQKDYTSSLEKRLKELQAQGVQATKEVQVSARRVVEDNARLKALLRCVGVEDHVIENWRPGEDIGFGLCGGKEKGRCEWKDGLPHSACLPVIRQTTPTPLSEPKPHVETREGSTSIPIEQGRLTSYPSSQTKKVCNKSCANSAITLPPICETFPSKTLQLPPCKVLTRLADNPSLDITQTPTSTTANPPLTQDDVNGGVECHQAHAMLMQFATSEEKLDVISQALERGCVGKKGGGCKVRNEEIWKAIDDVT